MRSGEVSYANIGTGDVRGKSREGTGASPALFCRGIIRPHERSFCTWPLLSSTKTDVVPLQSLPSNAKLSKRGSATKSAPCRRSFSKTKRSSPPRSRRARFIHSRLFLHSFKAFTSLTLEIHTPTENMIIATLANNIVIATLCAMKPAMKNPKGIMAVRSDD